MGLEGVGSATFHPMEALLPFFAKKSDVGAREGAEKN